MSLRHFFGGTCARRQDRACRRRLGSDRRRGWRRVCPYFRYASLAGRPTKSPSWSEVRRVGGRHHELRNDELSHRTLLEPCRLRLHVKTTLAWIDTRAGSSRSKSNPDSGCLSNASPKDQRSDKFACDGESESRLPGTPLLPRLTPQIHAVLFEWRRQLSRPEIPRPKLLGDAL